MKKKVLLGLATLIFGLSALLLRTVAHAGQHQLWDEAHFFKLATLKDVDQTLHDIHSNLGKDLMVETFASIPDDLKTTFERDGKVKFFERWTTVEATDLNVDGVMILICGHPSYIQVDVGADAQKKAFTLEDRDELVEVLSSAFKKHDFDAGISNATLFVRNRMARNLGLPAESQPATTQPGVGPAGGLNLEVETPDSPKK